MERHDTVIVGAGTAGLSCGMYLQDAGKDYVILDSKREIGKPIRSTGGVAMHFVNKLGMPNDPSVIAARIRNIRLADDDGHETVMGFDHDVGLIYDFTAYEKYMSRGLNVQLGRAVTSIDDNIVHTSDSDIIADNIIVATGPNSSLVPDYMRPPDNDMLVAYEETRKIGKQPYDLTIWFSRYADGGYVWDFADRGDLRRVGLGYPRTLGRVSPRTWLGSFTGEHPELDGQVDHTIAHQIPVGKPSWDVVHGHSAYIGDAANTCQADTGGGLQTAFWSGQLAARAIISGDIQQYNRYWHQEMYHHLLRHYKIKRAMYRIGTPNLGVLMDVMSSFKVRSEDASKEIPRLIWHVLKHKPSMIPKLIGAVV